MNGQVDTQSERLKYRGLTLLLLLLIAAGAFLVQGYHLGTDDAEIYQSAIRQIIHPKLYPYRAAFFLMHARWGHLSLVVGDFARILHVPADADILLWHFLGIFLMIFAGWRAAGLLFLDRNVCWAATITLALTFSVPVAGTALVIADPYLTARSLSTPLSLLAIASFLRGGRLTVVLWLLLTGLVHPQMVVYTIGLIGFLLIPFEKLRSSAFSANRAAFLSLPSLFKTFSLQPATGEYRKLLYSRDYFFASMWPWYNWLGVLLPLGLLFAAARAKFRAVTANFARVCLALVTFGLFSTLVALVFSTSARFDSLERLQPLRSFDLIYLFFFLILGGLAGEYLLRRRPWRWLALFLPLAAGMLYLNLSLYPASPHIELPGRTGNNPWLEAFYWIRANTPTDAFFALNPDYLTLPLEDQHGFRAIAERDRLADYRKDSGVATMFPVLTEQWVQDQQAVQGWDHFDKADFEKLRRRTGVNWVVIRRSVPGLVCPYRNQVLYVCRIAVPATHSQ